MDMSQYDQIVLDSDAEKLNKTDEEDEEDDEDVVYTAGDSLNRSLKMDLKKARTSIISYNKDNQKKNFSLSKSVKNRFVKSELEESNFVKIVKYLLINLSFLIYGASFCLIINSKEYFIELLNLDFISITNAITFTIFSVFTGLVLISFVSLKYDRFYLIFFSSLIASVCLIIIPFLKSVRLFWLLLFLFGFSFGTIKIISYKWCLKKIKFLNIFKLNLLYIQLFIGFFVCYFMMVSTLKHENSIGTMAKNYSMDDSDPLHEVKRQNIVENLFDNASNFTSTTTTTTTTLKHHYKPEIADGGELEQNRITKPNLDSLKTTKDPKTTKPIAELVSECILKLNKTCSFSLSNCKYNSTEQDDIEPKCDFKYFFSLDASSNIQSNEENCEILKNLNLNSSSTESNCFSLKSMNSVEDMTEKNTTCKMLVQNLENTCQKKFKCEFNQTSWEVCHSIYQTKQTTTTSTTSTTTTTSTTSTTTSTTTTTTTSTTATTTSTVQIISTNMATLATSTSKILELNNIMNQTILKLKEFYSNANQIQFFFIVIGVLNLILASLYTFLILSHLKPFVVKLIHFVCFTLKCFLCIEKFKSKRTKNLRMDTFSTGFKFTKLKNEDIYENERETCFFEDDYEERIGSADVLPVLERKSYLKMTDFWLFLAILATYGGLFVNFALFMDNYLVSRLTQSYFYQVELVNKFFILTFIVGRCLCLIYAYMLNRNNIVIKGEQNCVAKFLDLKIFKNLFNRKHSSLCLLLVAMFILSLIQLTSDHFTENLKLMFMNRSIVNKTQSSFKSFFGNVKLDLYTLFIFGALYPFFLSFSLPLLVNLVQDNKKLCSKMKANVLLNFIWIAVFIGGSVTPYLGSMCISKFKTYNIFIYTNIVTSFLLILFLILYSNTVNR